MSKGTTKNIFLQDNLSIVLITTMKFKTFMKGYHIYKEIWIPNSWKLFNNPKVKLNKEIAGNLKKGALRRFTKTIFFFLRIDPYSNLLCKSLKKVLVLDISLVDRVFMSRQNI